MCNKYAGAVLGDVYFFCIVVKRITWFVLYCGKYFLFDFIFPNQFIVDTIDFLFEMFPEFQQDFSRTHFEGIIKEFQDILKRALVFLFKEEIRVRTLEGVSTNLKTHSYVNANLGHWCMLAFTFMHITGPTISITRFWTDYSMNALLKAVTEIKINDVHLPYSLGKEPWPDQRPPYCILLRQSGGKLHTCFRTELIKRSCWWIAFHQWRSC